MFTALALLQVCLTIAAVSHVSMLFELGGLISKQPGENRLEYSLATMGSSLADADWSQHIDYFSVAVFLMLMLFILSIFLPLFQSISIALVSLAPWDKLGCRQQDRFK